MVKPPIARSRPGSFVVLLPRWRGHCSDLSQKPHHNYTELLAIGHLVFLACPLPIIPNPKPSQPESGYTTSVPSQAERIACDDVSLRGFRFGV